VDGGVGKGNFPFFHSRNTDDFPEHEFLVELEAEDTVFGFSEEDDLGDMDMMRAIDDFATLNKGEKDLVLNMVESMLKNSLKGMG